MYNDIIYIYVIMHIFFLILAIYILIKTNSEVLKKMQSFFFRILIVDYSVYLICSPIWTLQEYNIINIPYVAFYIITFFTMLSVSMTAFFFFLYFMIKLESSIASRKRNLLLATIPAAIFVITMLVSIKNGMIFTITQDKHIIYGTWYPMIMIVSTIYFIYIIYYCVKRFLKTSSYIRRREYLTQVLSIIMIIVCIIIDSKFDRSTILPMAIFAAIFFLFNNIQESSIYTDVLTSMNNRRKANDYIGLQLEKVSKENPLYLYMCDVNYFKSINDTYGHDEGDKALIIVSDVLKSIINKYNGFAARLGGDEFIFTWNPSIKEQPEIIIKDIKEQLKKECKTMKKPYIITLSIGYVICDDATKSFSEYIKDADEMLYQQKIIFHKLSKNNKK